MKIIQRIAFASIVATASAAFTAPSYAFMMDAAEATAVGKVDLTQAVDGLRQELKAGKTSCKEMLAKIDAAIVQVDSALDTGVADEKKYLGLRDELVELRLSLPCLSEELAQTEGAIVSDTVISEQVVGEEERREGGMIIGGSGTGGGFGGGGGGFGGGGLGGGGGLAGGFGPLALGGLAAAIAIPVALSGNNNPGTPASPAK